MGPAFFEGYEMIRVRPLPGTGSACGRRSARRSGRAKGAAGRRGAGTPDDRAVPGTL